ncbi:MAG: alpha/beta hydrolase, partial [Bacteroidia bacterium]|nr:alpha/beta hydrolase [Bacteroidia bacterium]
HGLSSGNFLTVPLYSDLILHLVDTLGDIDSIVSHSMGGFSTLYSFYRQPTLPVNKVVLMGSPGEARDFFDFYRSQLGLSPRTAGVIEDHFVSIFQQKPDYFSAAMFADGLPARGLIIHDEGDAEAPVHYARRIHEAWPNSTLVTTQGLGHNLKSPHVVGMVTDFVRQGSAQQAAKYYYENAISN